MFCKSIRRLTSTERHRRDELRAERYEELTAEIEAQEMHEYNEQFGPTYKEKHPFKPDGARVHERVEKRLAAEEHEFNQSRAENEQ